MAINVNGATPYQPITATKNKQTFKGSDVQSAPEQKEGGNALLWGSIAALGAAGLTYLATKHFDGKTLDAAKTQLKTAQESLGKHAKNFTEGCEALGLTIESSTGKIMQGEAAYSGEVISNGSLRHIIKDGERTKSVMDIVENGTKGTSEMLFSKGENGEKILTQTIKIGDNKPVVQQYIKQSDGSYNKLSGSLDDAGKFVSDANANPVKNAAIDHAPSPAAATDSAALKSAQTDLKTAQADLQAKTGELSEANKHIEELENKLSSLEADKEKALKNVQDELARAKNDLTAKENELVNLRSGAKMQKLQSGAAKTQQLKSGAKTQQLQSGAKTQTFTPFENAYISKNLKIENGRLVGVNGNYTGNLNLTSKNKNTKYTKYTLSFDEGRIVNVKTTSPKNGKSVSKNTIIVYNGNNVQVQTGGTNPIIATAKFDPATGTYNEVTATINRQNNGSMDLQTFLTQVLRVS